MDAASLGLDGALTAFAERALGGDLSPPGAGDIPALHWQGGPVDCRSCGCAELRALPHEQGCEPGYACMEDVYARRIDRLFRWHPALGDEQLAHPYFEVRAIAARHASVFRLPAQLSAMRQDPDYGVRERLARHPAILPWPGPGPARQGAVHG